MTLYISKDYYTDTFKGTKIPTDDIEKYLELAQEKIDSMTFNRIEKIGFDKLTDFQKEKVSKAICYQAEYILENGFNNEANGNVSSYSVLDISVNVEAKTKAEKESMSEMAYDLIDKTGLAYRGFYGFYR